MPAPYAELMHEAMGYVDDVLGEAVRILPRTPAGGRDLPGPDPARAAFPTTGTVRGFMGSDDRGGQTGPDWAGDMPADHTIIRIQQTKMPPYRIENGDQIQATDRPGSPMFEVFQVDTNRMGRVEIRATPMRRRAP